MKSVLISIKPKYCELIANGKKTIELRKTRPKLDTPFKCYIYETKAKCDVPQFVDEDGHVDYRGRGQVIGEFVCDDIDEVAIWYDTLYCVYNTQPKKLTQMCLTLDEVRTYIGEKNHGYTWHISDLKIYDKPKELSEFFKPCLFGEACGVCRHWFVDGSHAFCDLEKPITRPPQSWCYVEEVE